jgi:hypothetical protein
MVVQAPPLSCNRASARLATALDEDGASADARSEPVPLLHP